MAKAGKYKNGYGSFKYPGQPSGRAHRFAYEWAYGPIPKGLYVLHYCDNPGCVNPRHLSVGTHEDNVADKVRKGRQRKGPYAKPRNLLRGEQVYLAKLTEQNVRDMRAAKSAGAKQKDLAKIYGVTVETVSHIIRRHTWKHV